MKNKLLSAKPFVKHLYGALRSVEMGEVHKSFGVDIKIFK